MEHSIVDLQKRRSDNAGCETRFHAYLRNKPEAKLNCMKLLNGVIPLLEEHGGRQVRFEILMRYAKTGNQQTKEEIFCMYRPLLIKYAKTERGFDKDLYQELSITLKRFGS